MRYLIVTLILLGINACALMQDMLPIDEVKPWERNILAKDEMQLDANRLELMVDDKMYFSREAARGGGGFGGGGCGCN